MPSLIDNEYFQNGYIYNIQNGAEPVWEIGGGRRGVYGNLTGTTVVIWEIDDLVSPLSLCSASWLAFHTC